MAIVAVAGLIALLGYGVLTESGERTIDDGLAAGEPVAAAGFELAVLQAGSPGPRLGGRARRALRDGRIALDELRGVPVVLNFWASWCAPCREEAPRLERAWRQRARPRGVLMLGLDMQDARSDARAFLREFDISYPNIRDPTDTVARRYGMVGIPETFFISREGNVVGHVTGALSAKQLALGVQAAATGRVIRPRSGGGQRPSR